MTRSLVYPIQSPIHCVPFQYRRVKFRKAPLRVLDSDHKRNQTNFTVIVWFFWPHLALSVLQLHWNAVPVNQCSDFWAVFLCLFDTVYSPLPYIYLHSWLVETGIHCREFFQSDPQSALSFFQGKKKKIRGEGQQEQGSYR